MIAAAEHAQGFARLAAAFEAALGQPRPITTFPCQPFVPAHEMGPKDRRCKGCGRPRTYPEVLPPDRSDALVCGCCHRGSLRVDYVCDQQLRRDRARQHLINHNRERTKDTPRPAILDEPLPVPPVPARKNRTRTAMKEAVPC